MRHLILFISILAVLIISGCNNPGITGEIIYETQNCREIYIPYESEGNYIEQESYLEEECLEQPYLHAVQFVNLNKELNTIVLRYDVINLDNEQYRIKAGVIWYDGNSEVSRGEYIEYLLFPRTSVTVTRDFFNAKEGYSGKPDVIVPNKTVCINATKYREVTKYGKIMKNRTEMICQEN